MQDSTESFTNFKPRENASPSSIEDDMFVAEALRGSEDSYKKLVDKYDRSIYFHIRKMIKQHEMVEDLVQEVFIKAFKNLRLQNYNNTTLRK